MQTVSMIVLENSRLRAEFDTQTGALTHLVSKETGWLLQRRPELGMSFRMLAPLPGRRNNPILGEKQRCASCTLDEAGTTLTVRWEEMQSEHGDRLDITFTGTVVLSDDGLTFTAEIVNRSPYPIEAVSYPCLGDVTKPSSDELYRKYCGYAGMGSSQLLPHFFSDRGYYGTDYPINHIDYPGSPFVLLDDGHQGLYVGCHDTSAAQLVQFVSELHPGFLDSINTGDGFAPPGDEISGHPIHLEFRVNHFPFVQPGESASLLPIVVQPYAGSWHHGVDIYKAWRAGAFIQSPIPAWASDVHAWQQIHINSPEDELRCRYTELVQYGEDCAKHGVKAIQLVGWNDGGQDRGNPSHDTDPRLGTWEELQQAIADIQAMGVRMILFNKYTWADRSLPWFREELHKYASKDPYGDCHWYWGYQYQTPTQLADLNTRRFSPMCHNCADWRTIAMQEFRKSIKLGAAGMLYDESQHHGGAKYCFDASHGHRVPAHIFAGDATLAEDFQRIAAEEAPDYLFGGEACYDLEYRHYHISYYRIDSAKHVPVQRYIDPYRGIMAAVAGYDDRLTLMQCLLYRYIISYEPLHFKGRLDDFPLTIAYGKLVDAFRKRYQAYLWDAEFRDTQGAQVTVNDQPHHPYTVFRQTDSGKRAVVVANFTTEEICAVIKLDRPTRGLPVAASPEAPDAQPTDGQIAVPPRSIIVVMES